MPNVRSYEHSPADILYYYLLAEGLITDPDDEDVWPGFVASMPDMPNNALCFFETMGKMDGRIMRQPSETVEHPGVQVRLRSTTTPVGRSKANDVKLKLETVAGALITVVADTYRLHNCSRKSPILSIGVDKKNRNLYTINYNLSLTRES